MKFTQTQKDAIYELLNNRIMKFMPEDPDMQEEAIEGTLSSNSLADLLVDIQGAL